MTSLPVLFDLNGKVALVTGGTRGINKAISDIGLTGLALPGIAVLGGGSVILMSSFAGLHGNEMTGFDSLARASTAQLAHNLAIEWGPSNIRVNAISPGLIRASFARTILAKGEYLPRCLSLTPLRPPEGAGASPFLA